MITTPELQTGHEELQDDDFIVIIFDGQGVQRDGMGKDVYHRYAAAREVFKTASEAVGVNMKEVCFGGLAHLLNDTHIAQPAITTVSLAKYRAWQESNPEPDFITGLSKGLYTAVGVAALKNMNEEWDTSQIDHDTVKLVANRAAIMHDASIGKNGTMVPVIGPVRQELEKKIKNSGAKVGVYLDEKIHTLTGSEDAVNKAKEALSTLKATILENLPIKQAAHSELQRDTLEPLEGLLKDLNLEIPRIRLASNSATYLETPEDIIKYLLDQMTQPADWHSTEAMLIKAGVKRVMQFGADEKRPLARQMVKNSKNSVSQIVFPATI